MTGNQDLGSGDRKAELEALLEASPTDLSALNALTMVAIQEGDAPAAMDYNRRAFEVDAGDATAQTWKAVLAAAVGMEERALQLLTGTVASHPEHVDAWIYKGLIELRMGQAKDAVVSMERAQALDPRNPQVGAALSQARQVAAASGSGPPPAPAGPAEVVVKGTAALSPELESTLSGSETLYVSVRSPAGGPPLAALKLPMGEWPRAFEVTTANAIAMGGRPRPFPDTLRVVVTIDGDGNPMSKDDVVATVDLPTVTKGEEALSVTLLPPG
jgi:cytochrome c-type biogenesis protein CcmH